MKITCVIRYQIDPFQRDGFKKYAENWGRIIPRCGGHLVASGIPQLCDRFGISPATASPIEIIGRATER